MDLLESKFKSDLIKDILRQFPGAFVLKTYANQIQGIPDNIVIFGRHWAAFEAKRSQFSSHRPNQDYYINVLNQMSYATFVYPQNKEVFLEKLQQALRPCGPTRVP